MDDVKWMKEAIKQAKKAESYDEVPIGCVIVKDDKVIARGYNKRETLQQSIAHAEIMAIQKHVKIKYMEIRGLYIICNFRTMSYVCRCDYTI